MDNPIVSVGDYIRVTYIANPWWVHKYGDTCHGTITEINEDGTLSGTWGDNYKVNPETDKFELSVYEPEPEIFEPDPESPDDLEAEDGPDSEGDA